MALPKHPDPRASGVLDAEDAFPEPLPGLGNVDRFQEPELTLEFVERDLLARIDEDVLEDRLELPHLPATHLALLELTGSPEVDVGRVERLAAPDLTLTAVLLRIANSALYGGARRIDTLRGAILRIGLRGVRAVLFAMSVKSVIFRPKELVAFAEETWRQASSVGAAARALAVPLCLDPEKTYVLGLLHDVGKIPLLTLLRRHSPRGFEPRPEFVSWIWRQHHERVGRRLCEEWNLPDEIVAVAGCHHDFRANRQEPRSAALVALAHEQDLCLSLGDRERYEGLAESDAMEALELPESFRRPLLVAVRQAWCRNRSEPAV